MHYATNESRVSARVEWATLPSLRVMPSHCAAAAYVRTKWSHRPLASSRLLTVPAHSQSSFLNSSSGQKKRGAVLNAIFGQDPEQLNVYITNLDLLFWEKRLSFKSFVKNLHVFNKRFGVYEVLQNKKELLFNEKNRNKYLQLNFKSKVLFDYIRMSWLRSETV